MSRIRTFIKKVETAISSGDKGAAQQALRDAQPELCAVSAVVSLTEHSIKKDVSLVCTRQSCICITPKDSEFTHLIYEVCALKKTKGSLL